MALERLLALAPSRRLVGVIACLAALGAMLATAWPESTRPLDVQVTTWRPPPPRASSCGAAVVPVAVLADPTDVPDAEGESVWIRNLGAEPVALDGWSLRSGRARRALDDLVVAAGERLRLVGATLRPVRLPNRGGIVALVDPCGLATELAWETREPGHLEVLPEERAGPPWYELAW